MDNRILFAGTPEIAVPLLKALSSRFNVVGVLTSCDKSVGRSSKLVPTPVKAAALELGIPVLQFESLKTESRQAVKELGADTLVTFAYGKIFGPKFLALFEKGTFNVHPSALPMFRGASPIQYTIWNGLGKGSVSVQEVGLKMDEGDIWGRLDFDLTGKETTLSLTEDVSNKAAEFVPDILEKVFAGNAVKTPQTGNASYCRMIGREDGVLDFTKTAMELHAQIRTMYPWPKCWAKADGQDIAITGVWGGFDEMNAEPVLEGIEPGTVVSYRKDRGIGIACSDKVLWVTGLQLPAKKELDYKSFVNGNQWILKAKFS